MKKLFLFLILSLSFIFALAFSSYASSYGVFDRADMLSSDEEARVNDALRSASEEAGVDFYVGLGFPTESISYFLATYNLYPDNAVILLIEKENYTYYYEMHTNGDATDEISNSEANKILDNEDVFYSIKDGQLANGICAFASLSKNAYLTKSYTGYIIFLCISVLLGAIIFLVVVLVRYRTKIRGSTYPLDKFTKLELTSQRDDFVTKNVVRIRINTSSGSHGSRGGGSRGFSSRGRR